MWFLNVDFANWKRLRVARGGGGGGRRPAAGGPGLRRTWAGVRRHDLEKYPVQDERSAPPPFLFPFTPTYSVYNISMDFCYFCTLFRQLICKVPRHALAPPGGHHGDVTLETRVLNLGSRVRPWPGHRLGEEPGRVPLSANARAAKCSFLQGFIRVNTVLPELYFCFVFHCF